jgi:hopanoid biosynthesis associated RND transporter like protein HpnN
MLKLVVARIVTVCAHNARLIILAGLLLGILSTVYVVRHFAITTDINDMLSPKLPWRQRETAFAAAFPQTQILTVVEAPTPELVELATSELIRGLSGRHDVIRQIQQLDGGSFFEHNALLYLPPQDVAQIAKEIANAKPIIGTLAKDPSLRGELNALNLGLLGVRGGQIKVDALTKPLTMVSTALANVLAGRPATFSWSTFSSGQDPQPEELRSFVAIEPALNFAALAPGLAATNAITQTANDLKLANRYQARVLVTGQVPINDDQFASVKEGATLNTVVTVLAVLAVLWLALQSLRILLAVALTVIIGLAVTAALGLWMVGAFNLLSVAFAVLFIGLGVDFAIQFSVRYRAERHDIENIEAALASAGNKIAAPLALAAGATMIGFFSFLPTAYRGLAELGQIAGFGMLIAFLMSITVLPALLRVFNPPPEPLPLGFTFLAPLDRFLTRWRIPVIIGTFAIVILASPLLLALRFDFNPLHLSNPKTPSVAAFLDLRQDPDTGANAAEIAAASLADARPLAARFAALPEVSRVVTIDSLVPRDQGEKLDVIAAAAKGTAGTLSATEVNSPPTDAQTVQALTSTAQNLNTVAGTDNGNGATAARHLAGQLIQLAQADQAIRSSAENTFVMPLKVFLRQIEQALDPQPVSVETLPDELKRDWLAPDGRARVEVLPKGDSNDDTVLHRFVDAVLTTDPLATGPAVSLVESGRTVTWAFAQAAIYALSAIALLLVLTLRRLADVMLTLVPLLLAGLVTVEVSVLIGLPLNFANIIALPLLLGVGVAFKIYYMLAWRTGATNLLQSTLTRAVVFSAMTTGIAFGSLWFSNFPGTSSMGKMMALALVCTLAAAVLFQPVLMGPPRNSDERHRGAAIPTKASAER